MTASPLDLTFVADPTIAGVDEAGRGPLAGPVVAAAVILHPDHPIEGLRDSKKLSARRRERLAVEIRERALAFAVASASVEEIDRLNILRATLLAMTRAIEGLDPRPRHGHHPRGLRPGPCPKARALSPAGVDSPSPRATFQPGHRLRLGTFATATRSPRCSTCDSSSPPFLSSP